MIKRIMFFVGVLACGVALGAGQTATEAYVTNRVAALSNATWTAIASGDVKGTNYTDAVAAGKVSTNDPAYLAACTGSVFYAGLTTYTSNRVVYIGTNAFAAAGQTNVYHNSTLGIEGAGTLHVSVSETNRIANALTNTPTLQQVVTAGGTVTTGIVTIDAANARTNTYGGALGIGPERWQTGGGIASEFCSWAGYDSQASGLGSWANYGGTASGRGSWANYYGDASGNGSWANNGGVASGLGSWANGGGTASGGYSWSMGLSAVASNANSFAWNDQFSHGDGTFNLGAPSLLWLNGTNLQTLLDGKLGTNGLTPAGIAAAGGIVTNTAINLGTNHLTVTTIKPVTNSTAGVRITKADGTSSVLNVDTTNARVGIGTTDPATALSVYNASNPQATFAGYSYPTSTAGTFNGSIILGTLSSVGFVIGYDNGGSTSAYFDSRYSNGDSAMYFRMKTAGTPVNAMTIRGSGNVGFGTNAPAAKVHVVGSAIIETNLTVNGLSYIKLPSTEQTNGLASGILYNDAGTIKVMP